MREETECARWIEVARINDLSPGSMSRVSVEGIDIAICNADGELYAIGDTCTHAEASLADGEFYEDIRGWVLECPLHGSHFDITTGEAVSLPATGNTGKYALKVEEGVVYINPEPITPREE